MEAVETIEDEATGVVSKLYPEEFDHELADPRQHDNVTVMLCSHGGYELGDQDVEPQLPSHGDLSVPCATCDGDGYEESGDPCRTCDGNGEVELDEPLAKRFDRWVRAHYNVVGEVQLLGLIDHSGISMYLGGGANRFDPGGWDSGTVGVIFCTEERWKACMGDTPVTPERVQEIIEGDVQSYDQYLTGEVYFVACEDADGDTIESCGMFLGSEYAEQELKRMHAEAVQSASNEAGEAAYWAARDVLTT